MKPFFLYCTDLVLPFTQFSEAHFGPHRSQSLRAPTHHRNSKNKHSKEKQKQKQYCCTAPAPPLRLPRLYCEHSAGGVPGRLPDCD